MGLFFPARDLAEAKKEPSWWRVAGGAVILGLLFWGALETAERPEYAEASETLLRSFEISLAGYLALLGIETAKN